MYFVNCVCNPFLYSLLSQIFRMEVHNLLSNVINCNPIFKKSSMKSEHYGRSQENKSNSMVLCKNEKVATSLTNPIVGTIDIA